MHNSFCYSERESLNKFINQRSIQMHLIIISAQMVGLYNVIVYSFPVLHWKGLVGPLHISYCPYLKTFYFLMAVRKHSLRKLFTVNPFCCSCFVVTYSWAFFSFLTFLRSGSPAQELASHFFL